MRSAVQRSELCTAVMLHGCWWGRGVGGITKRSPFASNPASRYSMRSAVQCSELCTAVMLHGCWWGRV